MGSRNKTRIVHTTHARTQQSCNPAMKGWRALSVLFIAIIINLYETKALAGATATNGIKSSSTLEIISVINSLPNWGLELVRGVVTSGIAAARRSLVNRPTAALRDALQHYMSDPRFTAEAYGRAFLFNRIVFEIPELTRPDEYRQFAGWIRPPSEVGRRGSFLWPFTEREGVLYLVGVQYGYAGSNYKAVKEFDYFSAKFSRRNK